MVEVEAGAEQCDRIRTTLATTLLLGNTEFHACVQWLPISDDFVCLKKARSEGEEAVAQRRACRDGACVTPKGKETGAKMVDSEEGRSRVAVS